MVVVEAANVRKIRYGGINSAWPHLLSGQVKRSGASIASFEGTLSLSLHCAGHKKDGIVSACCLSCYACLLSTTMSLMEFYASLPETNPRG